MGVVTRLQRWTWIVLLAVGIILGGTSVARAAMYGDLGCKANVLPRNDDSYTGGVPVGFDFYFGGRFYSSLNISNNGYVVFGTQAPIWYLLHMWESFSVPLIALFHVDIDTQAPGSMEVTHGPIMYGTFPAYCVNWVDVGYYSAKDDKLNSFQLILVSRRDRGVGDVDVIMNYDRISWDLADGTSARLAPRVGIYDGTSVLVELPGSNTHNSLLDSSPDGLVKRSVGSPLLGQYIYPMVGGVPPDTAIISGSVFDNNGVPMAGALVQACDSCPFGVDVPCVVGSTDSQGRYSLSGFDPTGIADCPGWVVTASPPAGSQALTQTLNVTFTATDQVISDADLVLSYPLQIPQGTTIVPSRGGGVGGSLVVYWGEPLTLTTKGCGSVLGLSAPIATYEINQEGNPTPLRSGDMIETAFGSGIYVALVAPLSPHHGLVAVTMTLTCPDDSSDSIPPVTGSSSFNMYIDPSGFVRDTRGNPLVGAQVTLYRSDSAMGPFVVVPDGSAIMSPKNRNNPDYTDGSGHFGWDTLAGYYVVRAEYEGCVSPSNGEATYVETDVLPVPPEWLDLLLILDCEAITPPELMLPDHLEAIASSVSGAVVAFEASAHDGRDGDVPVTCTPASGSLFALGVTQVSCGASDSSGNVATGTFTVNVTYSWSNVLSPLDPDGANRLRAGRTVPVKFRLLGASAGVRNAVAKLYLTPIVDGVPGAEVPAVGHSGDSRFRYDPRDRQYELEWSTRGLGPGDYRLRIDLGDGAVHTVMVTLVQAGHHHSHHCKHPHRGRHDGEG